MQNAEALKKTNFAAPFRQLISDLKEKFKPDSILLFGSQAKGLAQKNSDYDVVLLFENLRKSRLSLEQDIYQYVSGRGLNIDVLVYSKQQFDELKNEFGSLPYEINKAFLEL